MKDRLTPLTIPSRKGRLAIVTGASSGVGKATARALGLLLLLFSGVGVLVGWLLLRLRSKAGAVAAHATSD